ncbi:MAG: glycosyl hydrolase [Phycisphaerales bacterium]
MGFVSGFEFRISCFLLLFLLGSLPGQARDLQADFRDPPPSARPWVYWFFMDGNLSREGMTADLEAMKQAGIGGVILMEVDVGVPKGPVRFMSEPWRELFKHAVTEAERLGLQMDLNAGPGWTGSGGPWVKPEQSMQHIVASETRVVGSRRFDGVLPQPQPRPPFFGPVPSQMEPLRSGFYRDVAVLAFPTPADGPGIADLDDKALYVRAPYSSQPGVKPFLPAPADYPPWPGIAPGSIVDLTDRMDSNGRLTWDVPEGDWTILRFGRTTTGANTRPAPEPGLGFECDKFDPAALDAHFDAFVGTLLQEVGPRPADRTTGWTMLHIDSWEMGSQNWSGRFPEEFRRRRGYDPLPYLPVVTGRVVESLEISERFLWDLRQTAQELVIENHAQHLKVLGRRHGFSLSIEPYDMNPCSDLSLGGVADVPMCEFWAEGHGFDTAFSCIEATSIAHTLGRQVVAAEAFTSGDKEAWRLHPGAMKRQADWAFCMGINRFVFHRYAHQPWLDRRPGMTMGPYGVHYERTQTWWPMVGAWHQYLARCQAMLQRGRTVADICYLAPEGAPHVFRPPASALQGSGPVPDRKGYNFDGCAPETLLAGAKVRNRQVVLPSGAAYRVLVLPGMETMTPRLVEKIRDLVRAGATVIGPRPLKSPSLSEYPKCDAQVQHLAKELWGPAASATDETRERRVGKGRVIIVKPTAPSESQSLSLPASTRWIWHPEGSPAAVTPVGTRLFRRTFTVEAGVQIESARLMMTADNAFEVRVNDKQAGQGDNFKQLYIFDVAGLIKSGDNLLGVRAENAGDAPNPAGLIGALIIGFSDGREVTIPTDSQWLSAESDQATWRAAMELGESGMSPWGRIDQIAGQQEFPDLYCDYDLVAGVLRKMDVPPDFESDANLRYPHRRDGNADIYFVANPADQPVDAQCSFRVTGKRPELWDPMTGSVRPSGRFVEKDKRTRMQLSLEPCGSAFVVFGKKPLGRRIAAREPWSTLSREFEIAGPWEVRFEPNRGAPEMVVMAALADWSKHPDAGVKYFSGQATYRTTFTLDPTGDREPGWLLDLGRVEVMAQVKLNGTDLGVLWKAPYQVEITEAIQPGENTLEVTVANLWPNRMIGDQFLPPEQRTTWATWNPYTKDSPLLESGLLGPVRCKTFGDDRGGHLAGAGPLACPDPGEGQPQGVAPTIQ